MSSFYAGYESYWCGVPYTNRASWRWCQGWLAAEIDDYLDW